MANKHVKRCLTLLAIWKIQIKTTMKYQYISVRTAKIKKWGNTKCRWGYRETGFFTQLPVRMQTGYSHSAKFLAGSFLKTKHILIMQHNKQLYSWEFISEKWKLMFNLKPYNYECSLQIYSLIAPKLQTIHMFLNEPTELNKLKYPSI